MASSSDNATNVNPTQVDSSDQPDELNQNQNQNTELQSPGLNTRNTAQISASPTQHITSNTYVFTTLIKLTQSNFMLWKSQVISSIIANELEGFVDGSHDHILLSWLLSSLSERVLGTVVDCSTSCEVWTTPANQFGARTRARILYLRTQIQTTKKGSSTIHEYYSKMKTLLNSLRAAGNSMNDDDFIMCVLAGLGPEYDSVVTNINSMQESPSISEVYGMLLSQENRTEQNLSSGNIEANYAQIRNGRRSWNNSERTAYQQLPEIVFRNPGNNPTNNQTNQNSQDNGKGKAVADDNGSDPKGHPNRRREQMGAYVAAAKGKNKLAVGNGEKLLINHIGYSALPTYDPHKHITLTDILYVPDITKNLISISKLLHENDVDVEFQKSVCFIKDKRQGKILVKGVARDGLYELMHLPAILSRNKIPYAALFSVLSNSESMNNISCPVSMLSFNSSNESVKVSVESNIDDESSSNNLQATEEIDVWQSRLGHPSTSFLKNTLLSCNQLKINKDNVPSFCSACQYGKQSKQSFKNTETKTKTALELIHTDLWGPAPILSTHGHRYYISFVDDRTRYTWLFPLATKSQALETFITFKNQIEKQLNLTIKALQTDMGGEFKAFEPYLKREGITLRHSCPYLHEQNGKDPKWKKAMEDEYHALMKSKTWTLIPNNHNCKLIRNKWIYKVKENSDGSINKYKARLVAKGFLQTPGLDFNETFSPVVKAATIRITLTMAVNNDWLLRQVDINNSFLNDDLTEAVYMPQPEGFEDKNKPNYICKLEKALYGLRQVPRAWFDKLKDDIIITGSDSQGIEEVIKDLNTSFTLKDLENLNFFLGIQVLRSQNSILLSQAKYIQDLLAKTEITDCKGIETPFSTSEKLKKDVGNRFHDPTLYRSVIGSLQYAVLTRPELAFSINKFSQFMSDPRQPHWVACKRVLMYLKNTMNMCLSFKKSKHLDLIAYTDADWTTDPNDRRSISGYCVYLGDNLVAWSSRKQGIVARSTVESEYRAMALCSTEITWINSLLGELKMEVENVPIILSDSTSAAAIAANPVYHSRTKHFEIDFHFLRDKVTKGELEINYVGSNDQIANVLTKPLPHHKFSCFRSKLKVIELKFRYSDQIAKTNDYIYYYY
ncbi:retrovirus-related pol polyprotein from transposon RE1 [Citrus sinensis]|nr:retrovirus-related pol polyprotein from transposon RE1 [Citrus sinensis]